MTSIHDDRTLTRADLDLTRELVESIVGRPLRQAEQAIDVLGLDEALNTAKDDVDAAIKAEQKRATARALRHGNRIQLELTQAILDPLERLFRLGRREALAELERLGYVKPRRVFVAEPKHPELLDTADVVMAGLQGLSIRLERARLNAETEGMATDAIARALLKIPGARAIAAGVISGSLTSGLAATFEANSDLVDGWEYTAVMDGGTCDPCGVLDGTTYRTLAELYEVLPGFGPNPFCDGGGRCRCRGVPAAA